MDYYWFQIINQFAGVYTFLNPVMSFLSEDAQYVFYLAIVIYWFTRAHHNRRMVFEALLSACVALGFGGILSSLFYRDRPFVTHHVIQVIHHAANASFPSDHATGAFVIAASIWLFRRKDGLAWLVFAACIAVSRVWTGVHYPSDVIAGALLGFLSAVAIHRLFARWDFAQRCMNYGIGIYEKAERKIWTDKQKRTI